MVPIGYRTVFESFVLAERLDDANDMEGLRLGGGDDHAAFLYWRIVDDDHGRLGRRVAYVRMGPDKHLHRDVRAVLAALGIETREVMSLAEVPPKR